MLSAFVNAFKVPDLRKKLLFTLFIITIYRLGSHIPVPGIDIKTARSLTSVNGGVLGLLNLFSGGALTQLAVFALGIMPYITSTIIMQLLAVVIPKLEAWQKEGEIGLKKVTQWTRYLTVGLAVLQSTGLAFLFHKGGLQNGQGQGVDLIPHFTPARVALIVLTLTAGTALIMWFGRKLYGGSSTYIPLKVNQAGVIPIIFASSVLYFPALVSTIIPYKALNDFLSRNVENQASPVYILLYGLLIIFFTYFYTAITFNPVEVADNMKKYGGFIPGIRPGRATAEHLDFILTRITLPGSIFLAAVAILPSIALALLKVRSFPFGGTSILITVGVALETMKQLESQLLMRHYEGFLT